MASFHYSGSRLDRAGVHRRDPAWMAALLADPAARAVPVWRDRNLICERDGDGGLVAGLCEVRSLRLRVVAPLVEAALDLVFLGLDGESGPIFAVDLSVVDEERAVAIAGGGGFDDLRRIGPAVSAADASLMAYARGMLTWHRRNLHCGVCGSPTESVRAGHVRQCTDPACGVEAFPRTDPAVIMLVERPATEGEPASCLLARHTRSARPVYSTLAGFVEPGESLEEAVAREVMEETGVVVDGSTYIGSQPWPFPASLMVGFRARASTSAIILDPEELSEACWFTAAELDAFGEWGDEQAAHCLPRHDSIARALVESWRADQRLASGR
ncbi:MAG: NAD(+) diphosphatase [Gemmatimonadaceae bacterium]